MTDTPVPGVIAPAPVSRRRRWLWGSLTAFVLVWIGLVTAAELYWPNWVEKSLSEQLSKKLKLDITMDRVETDALEGILHLYNFRISDQGEVLIGFRELHLDYSWLSIFSPTWLIEDAELIGPEIHVRIPAEGPLNLLKLVPPPSTDDSPGPRWHLSRLSVREGLLDFRDQRVSPARAVNLTPWAFDLKDIGTESADGKAELHGDLDGGARLDWVGSIQLQPLQSKGRLQLQRLALPELMRWVPDDLPVKIADGRLSIDLDYEAALDPEPVIRLKDSGIALDRLDIDAGKDNLASLDELRVNGIDVSWPAARWQVDSIRISGGDFDLVRDRDGRMRLEKLLAQQPKHKPVAAASNRQAPSPVWAGSLKAADINNINIRFSDESTSPASRLSLGPLNLKALPEVQNGQDTLALELVTAINEQGRLAVNGRVGMPSPRPDGSSASPFFRASIEAGDLSLNAFEAYAREAASVRLPQGRLGVKGDAAWQAGASPLWTWNGDIRLDDLQLVDARDNSRLVSARAIVADGLGLQGEPNRVRLQSLVLDSLTLRAALRPDGQLNFSSLGKTVVPAATASAQAAGKSGSSDWPTRIDNIVLRNNTLIFVDQTQKPAFGQAIRQFGGRISNIDLQGRQPAVVALAGQMPPLGRLAIDGRVTPAAEALTLDIAIKGNDIDLTGLSPYAGRYAGYRIDKGRLDTELRYAIQARQLKAENKVLLKEFTWGTAVDSPDATGLPVRLATALLKDMSGNIDIDLPLAGSLDDPQFRVWPLVWQALGNLITKAAAAPFKLLAGLAGGGSDADVSQIAFATGSSTLDATASERVGKLATALKARAGLQLEVRGMSDAEADKAAMEKARKAAGDKTPVKPEDVLRLGQARANAVIASLSEAGVPPAQIFRLDAGDATASNDTILIGLGVKLP